MASGYCVPAFGSRQWRGQFAGSAQSYVEFFAECLGVATYDISRSGWAERSPLIAASDA